MSSLHCEYCGHINRAGAEICETCDFPLDADREADPSTYEADSSTEPSWTAFDPSDPSGAWSPAADIPAPPFKGAGDVVSPMLAVYRKHFTLVGSLVLVTMVPEALLQYGFLALFARKAATVGLAGSGGDDGVLAFAALSGVLLWLLAIACGSLLSGSLVYAVLDLQRTGRAMVGECLMRGLKVLPKITLLTVLYSIITGVGFVLLIVPGIILSLMFAVCVPVAVVEGLGPIAALNRSHELTKGYKGLIFITYFLWLLLVLVLNWIITRSFAHSMGAWFEVLPTLLVQRAVLGMLGSSVHVLTVYIYLGLLRERRSGFPTGTFTYDAETAG